MTLKQAIGRAGLTQREFGRRIGVSESEVSLWCKGKRAIKVKVALRIADLLETPIGRIRW